MSDKSGVMIDTIELAIAGNRYVKSAKAFQHQRRIGLLVEPSVEWYDSGMYDEYNNTSFLDAIWADVETANESLITYSVINRDLIVVATKDKPLRLSAKGTVMDSSLEDYKREIYSLNLFTSPEILVA
ncbi:hypothetical protein JVU11DRAFT_10266 [Chiua virens]|nr:hypothetical protein JVU11DRAFT_10266 [Chiua virens]